MAETMTDAQKLDIAIAILKHKLQKEGLSFENIQQEISDISESTYGREGGMIQSEEITEFLKPILQELFDESLEKRSGERRC